MLGFLAGLVPADIIKNFSEGFGDVMGSVGIIIGKFESYHRSESLLI
jgi:H+/gluconate symporter-like permease